MAVFLRHIAHGSAWLPGRRNGPVSSSLKKGIALRWPHLSQLHSLHSVLIHSPAFCCFDKFAFQFFLKKSYNMKFSYYLCREYLELISTWPYRADRRWTTWPPSSFSAPYPVRAPLSKTTTDIHIHTAHLRTHHDFPPTVIYLGSLSRCFCAFQSEQTTNK